MTRKINRRDFLKTALIAGAFPYQSASSQSPAKSVPAPDTSLIVNDVHSGLNPTKVSCIRKVDSVGSISRVLEKAKESGSSISVCGARHAAGGQQFLTDGILLDTTDLGRIVNLDQRTGLITVESGIRWSALQSGLERMQSSDTPWGINQKQTGLNSLTVGGTLGANAHGQGLLLKPFVGDVDSFTLVKASGEVVLCNRTENRELFSLTIGGYGLFGVISEVTLRLVPRQKLQRLVHRIDIGEIEANFEDSVNKGYRYGHCQLNVDETSPKYLTSGVFATYKPVPMQSTLTARDIDQNKWQQIVDLVHKDKVTAYELYAKSVEDTNNQIDWADSWQNNFYLNGYHQTVDSHLHNKTPGSEVLSEFYVPLPKLKEFLEQARTYFLQHGQNVIFSSIRFIEKDDETFLPWARKRYACIVINFHTAHTEDAINSTMRAWSHLIDLAIALDGSFYLTYQHVANRDQLISCYPNFEKFLQLKMHHDPQEIFQSDWYIFYKKMFT